MSASHSTTRHLWRCDLIRGNVMFDLGFMWSRNWNEPCYIFDRSNCTSVCFPASIRACSVFCGICDLCRSKHWFGVYAVFICYLYSCLCSICVCVFVVFVPSGICDLCRSTQWCGVAPLVQLIGAHSGHYKLYKKCLVWSCYLFAHFCFLLIAHSRRLPLDMSAEISRIVNKSYQHFHTP